MVNSVRGMRDVLPEGARRWRQVEEAVTNVLVRHAYEEVQLPLLEYTELFARGVGESTDIVEKEMYNLVDRDGDSLSLRPEGTAGCVRALQENGLLFNQNQRVFGELQSIEGLAHQRREGHDAIGRVAVGHFSERAFRAPERGQA